MNDIAKAMQIRVDGLEKNKDFNKQENCKDIFCKAKQDKICTYFCDILSDLSLIKTNDFQSGE